VVRLRRRQQRNFLTTLLLSQGVPMILAGDELGRTQRGNNNAYCHDSELSWLHWDALDEDLLDFTRQLVAFRHAHPVFRRRRFFEGRRIQAAGATDIGWFTPRGVPMAEQDWQQSSAQSLAVFLNGDAIPTVGPRGERVVDDSFFVLLNGSDKRVTFALPEGPWAESWLRVLDTASAGFVDRATTRPVRLGARTSGSPRSIVVLQALNPPPGREIP
jgi:glycogen operon protein